MVLSDTAACVRLALSARVCHKGPMGRRLRDFASITDFFSAREIDELQAAIEDARREARARRRSDDDPHAAPVPPTEPAVPDNPGSSPLREGVA